MLVGTPTTQDANSPREPPRRIPLVGIFVAWTLWGVWSAQQSMLVAVLSGQSMPARTSPLPLTILSASFWALITPLLMILTRHIRDRLRHTSSRVIAHLIAFVCVHVADVTTYWVATNLLTSPARPFLPMLFSLVTFNALTYTVVAVVITALDTQETLQTRQTRESQLEAQLALAQFHALRAQLHPHFLFNALNAVSSLIHSDPVQADRMLSRISELLRTAIATATLTEIPLIDEMEFNRRYLDVERMRYGDRLDVHIDIAGETFEALVPNMLLQPLVENAVRHGIAPHAGNGRVEVRATRRGQQLFLVVRDTGAGFDMHDDRQTDSGQFMSGPGDIASGAEPDGLGGGVGIATTRARLRKLYGDNQQLMLVNVDGGFEVRVTIPFHVKAMIVA